MSTNKIYRDEIDLQHLTLSQQAEKLSVAYFTMRGMKPEVIDRSGSQTPDLILTWRKTKILCEVKAVKSPRRGEVTDSEFDTSFRNSINEHFKPKSLRVLPFYVMIESSRMELPAREESIAFANELENNLIMLSNGFVPDGWELVKIMGTNTYFGQYKIARSAKDGKQKSYAIRVTEYDKGINIDIPSYGDLNLRPIEQRIREADNQLRTHVNTLNIQNIHRFVAFYLPIGVGFHVVSFTREVRDRLRTHPEIGGAILFEWEFDGDALISHQFLHPTFFHNDWSPENLSISDDLFDDGCSHQIHNLDKYINEISQTGWFT